MKIEKILKYTCALFLANFIQSIMGMACAMPITLHKDCGNSQFTCEVSTIKSQPPQDVSSDTAVAKVPQDTTTAKLLETNTTANSKKKKRNGAFRGISLSFDAAGAIMALATSKGQWEGTLRANILNTYFPNFEAGWGISNVTRETTNINYQTNSPYFRIGCDYNFIKDKTANNKILGGIRFAYSPFKYSVKGPDMIDPVWGDIIPFDFNNISTHAEWLEIVFGLETKIIRFLHLGWTFRYKFLINHKETIPGNPWYIPGYGKYGNSVMGGSFNIIFDISKFSKTKNHTK